ncbi:MAG: M48 family metallopeptidase [Cyanobacteria bacterium P01_E01_bin.45]
MHGWRETQIWLRLIESVEWRWFHKVAIAIALLFALAHHSVTTQARAHHQDLVLADAELTISYAVDGSSTIYFNQWFDTPFSSAQLEENLVDSVEQLNENCQAWGDPYLDEDVFSYFLSCDRGTQPSRLIQQSQLNLILLLAHLQAAEAPTLYVSVDIPSSVPFRSVPAFLNLNTDTNEWLGHSVERFSASIDLNQLNLASTPWAVFTVEYGFRWQDLPRMVLPMLVLALLAPLLTAVGRRWALRHMQPNNKIASFQFQQWHSLSSLGIWGWWVWVVIGLQWNPLFELVSAPWSIWIQSIAAFAGMTAFPAAICLVCRWIAYPVIARTGRVEPPLKKVLLAGAIDQGVFAAVLAIAIFIPVLMDGEVRLAIVWLIGATASIFALVGAQARIWGLIPQSITVGPLRDRVFELASTAKVDIKQLYVLPTRKTQVANAFAVSGGKVMLTDYLLENLTKREVDAVIAHELAHFECKHHTSRGNLIAVVAVVSCFLMAFKPVENVVLLGVLMFLMLGGAFIVQMYQSRRHEHQADLGAARLTGDPEAMISALAAITELAEMPAQWNPLAEAMGTHPSLKNRANAIANAHQIPADRVEQLLLTADPNREIYLIPGEDSSEQPVYSSDVKSGLALKAVLLLSGTAATSSAGAVLVVSGLVSSLFYMPIALGSIISFMALLWVDNHIAQLGMKSLGEQLRQKFAQQGWDASDRAGVLVGFSPSLQPQLYEGTLFWDMGLLYLGSDRLAYVGEQTQFSLPIDAVSHVGYTTLKFEWFRLTLIQIQWCNADGKTESGYLGIREGNTAIALKRATSQWIARLQEWTLGNNANPVLPVNLQALPLPTIGTVTSAPLNTLRNGVRLLWLAVIPASALASIVLGLSGLNTFYVCVSASLALLMFLLPILLFTGSETVSTTASQPPSS